MELLIVDVSTERCLAGQRFARPKPKRSPVRSHIRRRSWDARKVASIEIGWINHKTFFATPVAGEGKLVQPFGTAAVHDPANYRNRHEELSALIETQERELATLPDLMKANGLAAFSLSSSPSGENDDDMEAANIAEPQERIGYQPTRPGEKFDPEAERNAQRYGVSYDVSELAPVTRRIEWERYILGCSQSNRISVELKSDGSGKRTIRTSNRRWTDAHRAAYKPHFLAALGELKSMAEYEAARARAKAVGPLVWSHMTNKQQLAWDRRRGTAQHYLDFADANIERESWDDPLHPETAEGGEYELSAGQLFNEANPFEPRELDLWPVTRWEREHGLMPIETAMRRADAAFRKAEAAR